MRTQLEALEGWGGGQAHVLLLQRSPVPIPAPTRGGSPSPVIPASGFHGDLYECDTHLGICTHMWFYRKRLIWGRGGGERRRREREREEVESSYCSGYHSLISEAPANSRSDLWGWEHPQPLVFMFRSSLWAVKSHSSLLLPYCQNFFLKNSLFYF